MTGHTHLNTLRLALVAALCMMAGALACSHSQASSFRSAALGQEMTYRIALPDGPGPFPVVYLLHGHGGHDREWFQFTRAEDAARKLNVAVVTPNGASSWYINSPTERWEDYVVTDLIADVEAQWPVKRSRQARAIAGLSMGGYGAMNLALRHPSLFTFAASTGGALDTARDRSVFDPSGTADAILGVFGPPGSATRTANDIFRTAALADPALVPQLWVDCGLDDPWIGVNREFAAVLSKRGIPHTFEALPGEHDWPYWDQQIGPILAAAAARFR